MAAATEIERIYKTLEARDPEHTTICVGGAAISIAFAEAGLPTATIPAQYEDVDVLCSQEYFDNLIRNVKDLEGVDKFQLRWPKGRLKEQGATNQSIDIYPDMRAREEGVLPFTACVSMSDLLYPIDYDSCINQPEKVLEAQDIKYLRLSEILRWISIIGREKDLRKVEETLPIAYEAGVLTDEEHEAILVEYRTSLQKRTADNTRPYARLDLSLTDLGVT